MSMSTFGRVFFVWFQQIKIEANKSDYQISGLTISRLFPMLTYMNIVHKIGHGLLFALSQVLLSPEAYMLASNLITKNRIIHEMTCKVQRITVNNIWYFIREYINDMSCSGPFINVPSFVSYLIVQPQSLPRNVNKFLSSEMKYATIKFINKTLYNVLHGKLFCHQLFAASFEFFAKLYGNRFGNICLVFIMKKSYFKDNNQSQLS